MSIKANFRQQNNIPHSTLPSGSVKEREELSALANMPAFITRTVTLLCMEDQNSDFLLKEITQSKSKGFPLTRNFRLNCGPLDTTSRLGLLHIGD